MISCKSWRRINNEEYQEFDQSYFHLDHLLALDIGLQFNADVGW
jgi:hypothetical protein